MIQRYRCVRCPGKRNMEEIKLLQMVAVGECNKLLLYRKFQVVSIFLWMFSRRHIFAITKDAVQLLLNFRD